MRRSVLLRSHKTFKPAKFALKQNKFELQQSKFVLEQNKFALEQKKFAIEQKFLEYSSTRSSAGAFYPTLIKSGAGHRYQKADLVIMSSQWLWTNPCLSAPIDNYSAMLTRQLGTVG